MKSGRLGLLGQSRTSYLHGAMTVALRCLHSLGLPLALVGAMVFGSARQAACSMHGLGVGIGASPSAQHTERARRHAAHGAHQHAIPPDDGDGLPPCHCTCLGDCTATQGATLPPTITIRVAVVVARPQLLLETRQAPPPASESRHLLPFANGPPEAPLS